MPSTLQNPFGSLGSPFTGTGQKETTGEGLARVLTSGMQAYKTKQDVDYRNDARAEELQSRSEKMQLNSLMLEQDTARRHLVTLSPSNDDLEEFERSNQVQAKDLTSSFKSQWSLENSAKLIASYDSSISTHFVNGMKEKDKAMWDEQIQAAVSNPLFNMVDAESTTEFMQANSSITKNVFKKEDLLSGYVRGAVSRLPKTDDEILSFDEEKFYEDNPMLKEIKDDVLIGFTKDKVRGIKNKANAVKVDINNEYINVNLDDIIREETVNGMKMIKKRILSNDDMIDNPHITSKTRDYLLRKINSSLGSESTPFESASDLLKNMNSRISKEGNGTSGTTEVIDNSYTKTYNSIASLPRTNKTEAILTKLESARDKIVNREVAKKTLELPSVISLSVGFNDDMRKEIKAGYKTQTNNAIAKLMNGESSNFDISGVQKYHMDVFKKSIDETFSESISNVDSSDSMAKTIAQFNTLNKEVRGKLYSSMSASVKDDMIIMQVLNDYNSYATYKDDKSKYGNKNRYELYKKENKDMNKKFQELTENLPISDANELKHRFESMVSATGNAEKVFQHIKSEYTPEKVSGVWVSPKLMNSLGDEARDKDGNPRIGLYNEVLEEVISKASLSDDNDYSFVSYPDGLFRLVEKGTGITIYNGIDVTSKIKNKHDKIVEETIKEGKDKQSWINSNPKYKQNGTDSINDSIKSFMGRVMYSLEKDSYGSDTDKMNVMMTPEEGMELFKKTQKEK